jgi:DNA-binding XRE family transcriptional regulator
MESRIGYWIGKRGYKKGYIAEQLGISRQQLSNWIGGRSHPPIEKAFELSKLLNCKVDDLYKEEEEINERDN